MADIFKKNPDGGYLINSDEAPVAGEVSTGNDKWDEYLTSLPQEDREEALKRLQAPLTGEELAEKMKRDPDFDIKFEDFAKFESYKSVQERHLMDDIMMGADGIMEQFGKAIQSAADHPSKALYTLGGTSVEALLQGTRGMVGMAAESQDPSSIFFNMKDVLTGGGTPEARYAQFLKAREFNRGSMSLATGKSTMFVNKDYIDHEITQAMSFIADPSWIIPFGKVASVGLRATGMGEHLAIAAARAEHIKHMLVGGTIKYAIGKPIELVGGATRNVIDFGVNAGAKGFEAVSGVGVAEANAAIRTTAMGATAANLAGISTGALADVSGVYLAGTSAAGVGEALSSLGGQVMRGKRGILSYAKAALEADKAILTPQAQSLLRIVNAFDPLVTIATDTAGGVASGAAVGAALGYATDRAEGLGHGIGAGMVLGGVGAVQGRAFATMKGGTTAERLAIQSKYVREGHLQLGNMKEFQDYSLLRKFGELTGTEVLMDGIISTADTLIPDVNFEFRNDKEHQKYLRDNNFDPATGRHRTDPNMPEQPTLFEYKNSNGLVMESRDGKVTMHINTEQISTKGTVVPHELFHLILRKSVLAPKYIKVIAGELLGIRDATGKLTQGPSVGIADTSSFFKEYIKRTYAGKDVPARLAAIDAALKEYKDTGNMTHIDKAINGSKPVLEHMVEEFGAYYFQHLILGERPDWLFFGGKFEGITGVLDRGASAWKDYWHGKINKNNPQFDFSEGISKGFVKEGVFSDKRVRIPALDYIMQDIVNSSKNLHKSNAFNFNALNKNTRDTLIDTQGWDALKRESGKADTKAIAQARKFAGQQAFKALIAANPNRQLDGEGNIAGRLDVNDIDTLVRTGHMSRAMGDKVLTLQRLADVQGRRPLITFGYLGDTQQYLAGNDQPRLTGKDVSYTNREVALLGFDVKIGKDGKYQFMARTLDVKVIEARGNNQWKQGSVRDLWNGSRADFDSDFLAYLSNASKDGLDVTRVPSAEILPNLDGKGALRRDVMHQMAGFVKESSEAYYNNPIAEVSNDYLASYTHFSAENMGKITETGERWDYNHANAFKDLSKNFMPSEMKFDETPNGKVFSHISGFKFIQTNAGKSQAFDSDGVHLGDFNTIAEATFAGKQVHAKQKEGINNVVREIKRQHDNGISFMPKEKFIETEVNSNIPKYLQNFIRGYKIELGQKIKEMAGAGDETGHEEHFNQMVQHQKDVNNAGRRLMQVLESTPDSPEHALKAHLEAVYSYEKGIYPNDGNGKAQAFEAYTKAKEILGATIDPKTGKDFLKLMELRKQPESDVAPNGMYKTGSKTHQAWQASEIDRIIKAAEQGLVTKADIDGFAHDFGMQSLIDEMRKDHYDAADKYEAKYKMGFRSLLKEKVLKMIEANPTWTIDKLRANILKEGSRGGKLWSEAKAMGLLDYIDSKMRVKYAIVRKLDAKGQPYARGTGQYVEIPRKVGDVPIDVEELTKFINENEIKITIDEGAKSHNVSDTQRYTFAGDKGDYIETAIRISDLHAHGVAGHYGGNTIVHHRTDIRFDSEGNKYLYIEEIQANNLDTDKTNGATYITSVARVPAVKTLIDVTIPEYLKRFNATKRASSTSFNDIKMQISDLTDIWERRGNGQSVSVGTRTDFTPAEVKQLQSLGTKMADVRLMLDVNDNFSAGDISSILSKPYPYRNDKSTGGLIAKAAFDDAMDIHRGEFLRMFENSKYLEEATELSDRYSTIVHIADYIFGAGSPKDVPKGVTRNEWVVDHLLQNKKIEVSNNVKKNVEKAYGDIDTWRDTYGARLDSGFEAGNSGGIEWDGKLPYDSLEYISNEAYKESILGTDDSLPVSKSHPKYNDFSSFSDRRVEENAITGGLEMEFREMIIRNPEMKSFFENHPYYDALDSHSGRISGVQMEHIASSAGDFKTAMQQDMAAFGKKGVQKPLQEIQEWAKIALITLIRESIRRGVDNVALTHPDDAPTVSNMDYADRHGLYNQALPNIFAGFLKKFGIEIEKGASFNQDIKALTDKMAGTSTEVYKNNKAVLDWYKTNTQNFGEDVSNLSSLLAEPVHEMGKHSSASTPLAIEADFRESAIRATNGTRGKYGFSKHPEFQSLIKKAVEAKINEFRQYTEVKKAMMEGNPTLTEGQVMSEFAISRSTRFKVNEKLREAFLQQDNNQILKAYMPKEDGQGGRTYDYNSKSWLGGFIGRYAAENPEQTKNLSIQLINKTGGVTRLVFTDTSGASKNVGHIEFDKFGGISTNIAPEYRGKDLSYLLYSEAGERMRALGIKESVSTVTNEFAIPVKSRERTFGDTMHWQGRGKEGIPITREQAAEYIAQKKATQVEEGRSYSGINISNKLEQNKWYMPKEEGAPFAPNSKKAMSMMHQYLAGLRSGRTPQEMKTPEMDYLLGNIDQFTKASNDDIIHAISKVSKGDAIVEKLNSGEITLKQAVEQAKSADEYTYLARLKDIRDERKGLHNAFLRASGEMRQISDTDARRSNTHAERESRNTKYQMPREEDEPIRLSGKMKTISLKDTMGDIGGRVYDPKSKEFKSSFIGRQAYENPEVVEGIKLRMKNWEGGKGDYGKRSIELLDGTNLVGRIDYDIRLKTAGNKHNGYMLYDPTVWVEPEYRGKGYSNILYSEMAERARALGAQDFLQRIENEQGLPMKAQVKVFGFGESKLIDTNTNKSFQPTMENFNKLKNPEVIINIDGVEEIHQGREPWVHSWSKLFPDRWYMPKELAVAGQNPNVKKGFLDYIARIGGHLQAAFEEGQKPETKRTQNYLTLDKFKPEDYRKYHFLAHGPDTASTVDFVDALSGEVLHKGQGGGNYPAKFPDKVWASTKGMGNSLAEEINAVGERNLKERGEWIAPVALLKSDPWKMRGTVNGANGYINTINKLSERGVFTRKQFKDAIGSALITDKMKAMGISKKTLGIDFNSSSETQVIDALRQVISDPDMSIATRKVYVEKINAEVFHLIKGKLSKAESTIPTLKGKTITEGEAFGSSLFEMFEDPMAQHAKMGEVYMTLLIRHPVKGEASLQHASYPDTVRTTGGEPIQQDWLSQPIDPKILFKQRFNKGNVNTETNPLGLTDLEPENKSSFMINTGQTQRPYQAVKAFQPNEGWRQWTPEKTASGIIYRNLVNYSIIYKDNKFKVYNAQRATLGIYDSLASAQKRVEREEPKEKKQR